MDKDKNLQEIIEEIKLRFRLYQEGRDKICQYNEGVVDGAMMVLACYNRELFFDLLSKWVRIRAKVKENEESPIHSCPACGDYVSGYVNIYKQHWFYCYKCLVTWLEGENLFSSWEIETPDVWEKNKRFLNNFKVVEC